MCLSKTDINASTIKLDIDCFNIKLTVGFTSTGDPRIS